MLTGWIDGPPDQVGTYWVIYRLREGLSSPDVWEIEGFKDNGRIIYGMLAPWIWTDKSIILKHAPVVQEEEDAE